MQAGPVLLCGLAAAVALAQPEGGAYRRMEESKKTVNAWMARRAREITDHAGAEIQSRDRWEKVRAQRLEEMRDMLGLLPWPARTPLNVRVTGTLDRGEYTIEKIAFESLPGFYVTGNLYVPNRRSGRVPGVIYVCGHAASPYGAKTQYQRHGISFAKNGYVAFILDPIQIAEIFSPHHGVHSEEMYDWYSRGYTPAGVETWNAMRAIDYLETRSEVDRGRIGMTGRSGGAAMSWFTAAVDPRIKVSAPIMGISTYAADVPANTQALHCDCMFPINSYLQDLMHLGALIAPRPLLFGEGRKDNLFPVPGYLEFLDKVGSLYRGYGNEAAIRLVEVDTGHKDSDFLRETVIHWFDRHLMGAPERKLDMDYSNVDDPELTVFGGKPPAGARNGRVWEYFTTRPPSGPYANLGAWKKRSVELAALLREKVFRAMPSALHNVRATPLDEPRTTFGFRPVEVSSDETVPVRALVRAPSENAGRSPAVLYVASDTEDADYIGRLFSGLNASNAVNMAVFPRGVGEVPWDKTFWKDTLRSAMFIGETVDSMRLADVLAAVEALSLRDDVDPGRIAVLGRGVSGALGLYAAILNPKIAHVAVIDPPATHADGPIFLNVMRYTDLPEAAALVAPRRLTFYGRMPAAYEYSKHIWRLFGKPGNIETSVRIDWTRP